MPRNLRPLDIFPITTRTLQVLRVTDISPGMRRITLGGPELNAHTAANGYPVAAFRSTGFDDEFKILLKHPDAPDIVGPTQADGLVNWPRGDEHMVMRTYTVRRWDSEAGELDIDFVVHGLGPATSWARSVQPGEPLQIAGPKMSAGHPEGTDWVLIAGDETALPAIGRWLEQWPSGVPAQVFIEIGEESHRQDLPEPVGVEITWLVRNGKAAGTTTLLLEALEGAHWWEGSVFAWIAGESMTLVPIRRWLRTERRLAKEHVEVTGYWRKQAVVVSADDATQIDLDATTDDSEILHDLGEIVPGFALRVASTIGLTEAFLGQPRSLSELVDATGSSRIGVSRLLRYLEAVGLVERAEDAHFRLTSIGRGLENEHLAEHLNLEKPAAHRELAAMITLLDAVRNPETTWNGSSFREDLLNNPGLLTEHMQEAEDDGVYVVGALAEALEFQNQSRVLVSGIGAGSFAHALVQRHRGVAAKIVATPSELEVLSKLQQPHERVEFFAGSMLNAHYEQVDAVLLADALRELPDADAVHMLRTAALSVVNGGRVLVFCETLDRDLAREHDYEEDLILFALHRGGLRTNEEYLQLFTEAGLPCPEHATIGWGYTLYAVTPLDATRA